MAQSIDKDIKFDRYGDISFIGNDIDILYDHRDILYQNIVDRLITNFGDYDLYPELGANLSGYIGQNSSGIESLVQSRVKSALIKDGFLDSQQVVVIAIRDIDKVHVRISVRTNSDISTIEDKLTINAIYNTSSGMFYATN